MFNLKKRLKENKGFTLAELLIVVAIIAVLVAVSIPIFTTQLERLESLQILLIYVLHMLKLWQVRIHILLLVMLQQNKLKMFGRVLILTISVGLQSEPAQMKSLLLLLVGRLFTLRLMKKWQLQQNRDYIYYLNINRLTFE
ncbi:MAG: prepilin-type N-terminal cleavage/methylation domain-containing protein [Lachnospiraceae bacterium]|nr:prepilin-type N-terminal cleavage/methylation domain-containing protein [Lachnospiraceae bacterium]MDD3615029.1 prepilin-type N-terminal cleavage/methylation domain-containing protein [Lachnospiraceae bacterium]